MRRPLALLPVDPDVARLRLATRRQARIPRCRHVCASDMVCPSSGLDAKLVHQSARSCCRVCSVSYMLFFRMSTQRVAEHT